MHQKLLLVVVVVVVLFFCPLPTLVPRRGMCKQMKWERERELMLNKKWISWHCC